jgi:NADH-quinone oxidoreductase subunit C
MSQPPIEPIEGTPTVEPVLDTRIEARLVRAAFPTALLKVKEDRGETFLCLDRDQLVEVATFLRDNPELEFKFFSECMGVDYSTWSHPRDFEDRFEVVYNLFSLKLNARIFLKVGVNDGQKVPTLKHVYQGAEFPEREVWDLFGVIFAGNEQTQRFLLPDDWIGFPLRKEFPLGGDDVLFDQGQSGPAVQKLMKPHAGESFEGKTGTEEVSGR